MEEKQFVQSSKSFAAPRRCPKCESSDLKYKYIAPIDTPKEYLEVRCLCGYKWEIPCLDAK